MLRKLRIAASSDGVLPEDMLLQILVRLPAKTICLFRVVCRSWRSLLSDPLFVAAHKSHHPGPVIFTCTSGLFERHAIEILDLSGNVVKQIATSMKDARLVRTCRLDLICVTGWNHCAACHVINPATGDTFALPIHRAKEHAHVGHFFPVSFDFGQVGSTGEYKAIRCVSFDNSNSQSSPLLCEVITLDDGRHARWRGKQGPPAPIARRRNKSVVVNGVAHFLLEFRCPTFSGDHVEPGSMALFNLETEEWMGILKGPMPVRSFVEDSNGRSSNFSLDMDLSLVCLDGFLVMAHDPEYGPWDLWFLMDIEKCLWNKRYSIDPQYENLFAQPVDILNDGRIIISASGLLRFYNPVTKTYTDCGMRESTSVGTYTGSLLSSESTFTSEAERCTTCGCYFTIKANEYYDNCEDCMLGAWPR